MDGGLFEGWTLIRGGRLLDISVSRVGAYSRGHLIEALRLVNYRQINDFVFLKCFVLSISLKNATDSQDFFGGNFRSICYILFWLASRQ